MALRSTSGQPTVVTDIQGNYDVNIADDYISIAPGWVGGTVTLPGPLTNNPTPNNGDRYTIADPQNELGSTGHALTINGGGFRFLAGNALVTQSTTANLTSTPNTFTAIEKTCISFVFDEGQQLWIVC